MLIIQVVVALTGNQTPVIWLGELSPPFHLKWDHLMKKENQKNCVVLLQENHQRVNIFFDYAKKTKNTAWSYFLPMLNRQDLFTVHMVSYE